MASLRLIRHLLCEIDLKYPSRQWKNIVQGGKSFDISRIRDKDLENYYLGTASAYKTTQFLLTEGAVVLNPRYLFSRALPSGAREVITYFHRVIVHRDGRVTIVDPRSIFTPIYNKEIFSRVPPILEGEVKDLEVLRQAVPHTTHNFWLKRDGLETYVDSIIMYAQSAVGRISRGDFSKDSCHCQTVTAKDLPIARACSTTGT